MSGKNVLIVYAHQEPKSMNGSLKNVAVDVLSKMGCSVTVSDLYAMQFNAAATRNDITGELCKPQQFSYGIETMEAFKKGWLCEDIIKEQKKIQEADLVIFQFPLYWFSFPAIMKGWIDRCFIQGFAFDFPGSYETGFLKGKRSILSFTTGGTEEMFSKEGLSGDIRYLLWPIQKIPHEYLIKLCKSHCIQRGSRVRLSRWKQEEPSKRHNTMDTAEKQYNRWPLC
ncbi:ribosyldihydronicotinamide dehydrogenase [quinone] isoform 2-T2 [Anomaloglossus baeobatrachus]|uniref:ribosyldihydronicotinamide dehydrogenase [quinone] isoform X2 n=1 Tax=Anomaloglossus baeobatrachus TaxID=238106 RepID=UPI003F50062B